ncbi:hypothetical protein BDV06DRAFT_229957 [Aspergillus oleicola]
MSLGSVKAALVNGISEATATLVNLNLDFSLIRLDAPKEFSPVGAILSPSRRESAESGLVHTTARKLGALFDPLLPDTPELIKAYGTRASEIANKSKSENNHTNYGVFQSQVGVDATSIWASATSGAAAIKAHLLACILARMWESGEATAVWDEIVGMQKQVIMDKCNEGGSVDMVSWVVAKQQISREELRAWDASARAWLCIADKVKADQQNQFWLAIDKFDMAVTSRSRTYDSVIEVWKDTLAGMELLVSGVSQELRTVNLLLGLSALHLYPDMDIVTKKQPMVRQTDPLVPGILTVGLSRYHTTGDAGIRWSLPLAQLRYYGDPVQRTRLARAEGSRVTLVQFRQLILGCVLGGWNVHARQTHAALQWIVDLDEQVKAAVTEQFIRMSVLELHRSWLSILAEAAQDYLHSDDLDRRVYGRLLNLGRRKAGFLGQRDRPFFGLGEPEIFMKLLTEVEDKIMYLRTLARTTSFMAADMVIRYRPDWATGLEYEYATAIPRPKRQFQDMEADSQSLRHTRWLRFPIKVPQPSSEQQQLEQTPEGFYYKPLNSGIQVSGKENVRPLDCEAIRTFKLGGKPAIHWDTAGAAGRLNTFKLCLGDPDKAALFCAQDTISPQLSPFGLPELIQVFKSRAINGSHLLLALDKSLQQLGSMYLTSLRAMATVVDLYKMLPGATIDIKVIEGHLGETKWAQSLGQEWKGDDNYETTASSLEASDTDSESDIDEKSHGEGLATHRLYTQHSRLGRGGYDAYMAQNSSSTTAPVHPRLSDEYGDVLDPDILGLNSSGPEASGPVIAEQGNEFDALMHMHNLAEASPGITEDSFDMADYVARDGPERTVNTSQVNLEFQRLLAPFKMTRGEAFACIILFESGQYDIPPEKLKPVMALSSNDSLFIAAPMLCSPADEPPAHEIHHVTGNIGRGGIALLIPPAEPRIRKATSNSWNVCNHDPWDGKYIDCFAGTSLHLSYTGYNIPLDIGTHGAQDWEIYLLEAVVSVHEQGEWVADLDILKALQSPQLRRIPDKREQSPRCAELITTKAHQGWHFCAKHAPSKKGSDGLSDLHELVSLQNWTEFLMRPGPASIVVASSNWQAQLAATSIAVAQGDAAYIVKEDSCCYCICDTVLNHPKSPNVVCIS